jgi:hypothetical protein
LWRCERGHRAEQSRRKEQPAPRNGTRRERIDHGQADRPDGLLEIELIAAEHGLHTLGERILRQRVNRAEAALSVSRNDREDRRDGHQRQLFDDQSRPGAQRFARRRIDPRPRTSQRPGVEHEQQKGQRHEHRLGSQAEKEARRHGRIARHRGRSDETYIGDQGQQAEQRTQDVFAFRHPGDRFDVQRMDGK